MEGYVEWAQYGGVIWGIFGRLFLYLMVRGEGYCAGHCSHGGHGSTPEQKGQYAYETL